MISALLADCEVEVFADFPQMRPPYGDYRCPHCRKDVGFRRPLNRLHHFFHKDDNPQCPLSASNSGAWNKFTQKFYNFFLTEEVFNYDICRQYTQHFVKEDFRASMFRSHQTRTTTMPAYGVRLAWAQLYFFPLVFGLNQTRVILFLDTIITSNWATGQRITFAQLIKFRLNSTNILINKHFDWEYFLENLSFIDDYIQKTDRRLSVGYHNYFTSLLDVVQSNIEKIDINILIKHIEKWDIISQIIPKQNLMNFIKNNQLELSLLIQLKRQRNWENADIEIQNVILNLDIFSYFNSVDNIVMILDNRYELNLDPNLFYDQFDLLETTLVREVARRDPSLLREQRIKDRFFRN